MRAVLLIAVAGLVLPTIASSAQKTRRYGVALDTKTYPQATPKEALRSVLAAANDKKFDYLAAQLADPGFVEDRVERIYGGKFEEQVDDTRARLDPATLKLLKRFLDTGRWTVDKTAATVRLDDVKDRTVRMVRKGERWYLRHGFKR